MSRNKSYWFLPTTIAGVLLMVSGSLGWFVSPIREDGFVNTVLFIAASSIGWIAGMLFSPDTKNEQKKFSELWRGITLFVSGYLLSKMDPLVTVLFRPESMLYFKNTLVAYRVLSAICAFILTGIITYIVRVYTLPNRVDMLVRMDKLIE